MEKTKQIRLDKWFNWNKKRKLKKENDVILKSEYTFEKKLRDYVLLFIIEASRFIKLSKTTIFKLLYYAQKENIFKMPIIPNIYYRGVMSKDINLTLQKIERENIINYFQENLPNGSKLEKSIVINPEFANKSYEIASRLGVSLPEFQRKIKGIIRRLPMLPLDIGKKNKKDIIKLIKDRKRYYYSHWPDIDKYPAICIRGYDLSLTKINLKILELIPRKDPIKKSIQVAKEIINKKENLANSLLDLEILWKEYKNGRHWEKLKGCICLIGVVFTKIIENKDQYIILEALDSYMNPKTVKVILKKDGLNSDLTWEQVLFKIFYLLGEIDSLEDKLIIKGRALIHVSDINSREIIDYLKRRI